MRNLPPLAAVRVFEAAARHGNFTRAAEELGMTQAAVSYQMKLLEERLGAPLFARSGRGIVLSDVGQRISPQVTAAFDLLGEAFVTARAESESVLTISAPRTFATNWLAGRVGSFQLARSPLAVRLQVTDAIVDFGAGETDVAIRGSPEPWPGLVAHFLMRIAVTPFASPALIAKHPRHATPDDILAMPRVSHGDEWWRLWFDSLTGCPPDDAGQAGVRFDSQVLDGAAALAGHGVALLNPLMWQDSIAAGLLVQVHPHIAYERDIFWLVYPERKRNLAKVRAFRDWLIDAVRLGDDDAGYGAFDPPGAEEPSRYRSQRRRRIAIAP